VWQTFEDMKDITQIERFLSPVARQGSLGGSAAKLQS